MKKLAFISIIFIFILHGLLHAADVARIGVIDVQKIVATTNIGKAARAELEKIKDQFETDLKEKKSAINNLKRQLEREAMLLSKKTLEEKNRKYRIMINDFKTLQKKYRVEFQQHVARLNHRIEKKVMALAEDIGRKKGYLLIIERRRAGVLYSLDKVDITDEIIMKFLDLSL